MRIVGEEISLVIVSMRQGTNLNTCTMAFVLPAIKVDHQHHVINKISRC